MHPVLPCLLLSLSSGVAAPVAEPTPPTPTSAVSEQPEAPQPALNDPEAWQRRWSRMGLAEALAETADICPRVPIGDIPAWLDSNPQAPDELLVQEILAYRWAKAHPASTWNATDNTNAGYRVLLMQASIQAWDCAQDPVRAKALIERLASSREIASDACREILARTHPRLFIDTLDALRQRKVDVAPSDPACLVALRTIAIDDPAQALERYRRMTDVEGIDGEASFLTGIHILGCYQDKDFVACNRASFGMDTQDSGLTVADALVPSGVLYRDILRDPEGLMRRMAGILRETDRAELFLLWCHADPDAAGRWLKADPNRIPYWALAEAEDRRPIMVFSWIRPLLDVLPDAESRMNFIDRSQVFDSMPLAYEPQTALDWILAQPDTEQRNELLAIAAQQFAPTTPHAFLETIRAHPPIRTLEPTFIGFLSLPHGPCDDPGLTFQAFDILYAKRNDIDEETSNALAYHLSKLLARHPARALAYIDTLEGPAKAIADAAKARHAKAQAAIPGEETDTMNTIAELEHLLSATDDPEYRALRHSASLWAWYRPDAAIEWLARQPDSPTMRIVAASMTDGFCEGVSSKTRTPGRILEYLQAHGDATTPSPADRFAAAWAAASLDDAKAWLDQQPPGPGRDALRIAMMVELLKADPVGALADAAKIADPKTRDTAVNKLREIPPAAFDKATRTRICGQLDRMDIPAPTRAALQDRFNPERSFR